jgi:hypothetical protein
MLSSQPIEQNFKFRKTLPTNTTPCRSLCSLRFLFADLYGSHLVVLTTIPLHCPLENKNFWHEISFHSTNKHVLVDLQLDAQNSYLFTYNTFIRILYMFRALPCSSSRGLHRNCIYAVSGIVTVCRWLFYALVKKEQFFLNRCTRESPAESDNIRGCIYIITT